jgi:hypothetical protein
MNFVVESCCCQGVDIESSMSLLLHARTHHKKKKKFAPVTRMVVVTRRFVTDQMPLSMVKSAYQAIQSTTLSTRSLGDLSSDPFHVIFPTDNMIMFFMSMEYTHWDDGHHHSILFLK